MNKTVLSGAAALFLWTLAAGAQETHFLPKHLAVLRAGDGVVLLKLRQSPTYLDQFDPNGLNMAPSFTVAIPTNGANSFFFNGHAATEGNLTRSSDHKLLAFAGYGGVDLLKLISGTNPPSVMRDLKHGFSTVDSAGSIHTYLYKTEATNAKVNARGVATDGKTSFWACGNTSGTFYYGTTDSAGPVRFDAFQNSRAIKIIGDALYATINDADANASDQVSGIYGFNPSPLPRQADTLIHLVVPAEKKFKKVIGFDMNTNGTIAYMSDTDAGVQKYVKTGEAWKFAYEFTMSQSIPKDLNNLTGCYGLAVDFSGSSPVIFATTTEGYGGSVNSNRLVRIVDTNANAVVTTLYQVTSTNIALRGVELTPE